MRFRSSPSTPTLEIRDSVRNGTIAKEHQVLRQDERQSVRPYMTQFKDQAEGRHVEAESPEKDGGNISPRDRTILLDRPLEAAVANLIDACKSHVTPYIHRGENTEDILAY